MGLRRTAIYWRPLTGVTESQTPSVLLGLYRAVMDAARSKHLNHTPSQRCISEEKIREQMVEMIGRSLQRRPSTLPSVGYEATINGELWHVILNATAIPHLSLAIVECRPMSESETAYRWQLVRSLLGHEERSYGLVEDGKLSGNTWDMFLFCKVRAIKRLRDLFAKEPFQRQPMLLAPNKHGDRRDVHRFFH